MYQNIETSKRVQKHNENIIIYFTTLKTMPQLDPVEIEKKKK